MFSKATRTASTTNAVKVHGVSLIAFSTFSITSFGKRIHLLVVGGTDGILNFRINSPHNINVYKNISIVCITNVLHTHKINVIIMNKIDNMET